MNKTSGTYKIESKLKPERIYIGSSIYLKHRWKEHLRLLKLNKHHSPKLQRHFNKYGESDLVFTIIEPCLPQFLVIREDTYLHPLPYFNICPTAGSCLGLVHSEESRKKQKGPNTEEWKQRITGPNTEEWKLNLRKPKSKEGCKNMGRKKGSIPWNKGIKGVMIPWNKGRIGVYTKETIKLMTESRHNRAPLSEQSLLNMGAAQKKRQERERLLKQTA